MTVREAAAKLLGELGPTHYKDLTQELLSRGLLRVAAKVPEATVNTVIASNIAQKGEESDFQRVKPGVYARREYRAVEPDSSPETQVAVKPADQEVDAHAGRQAESVRKGLRELLLSLESRKFERLVLRILRRMGFGSVEVKSRSGTGSMEVVGKVTQGILTLREAVRVTRNDETVQYGDVDSLRAKLFRFDAARGTIVAISGFSEGAVRSAAQTGVVPIRLIDGAMLVDVMIRHGLGVRKRAVEVLSIDLEALGGTVSDG